MVFRALAKRRRYRLLFPKKVREVRKVTFLAVSVGFLGRDQSTYLRPLI